jgi:hypothetical protein
MQKLSDEAAGDASRWRRLELDALNLAASMKDPQPRRIMQSIAEAYRRLAERAALRDIGK